MKTLCTIARPNHWVKNLLVFLPLVAAHRWKDSGAQMRVVMFFGAFCCAASAVYIFNDWMDVESDRNHREKRMRPLASGLLSGQAALACGAVLLLCSSGLALQCGLHACLMLILYMLVNVAYTLRFKRVALLDVIVLAGYYVIRIIGGALAANVDLSPWLSSMGMFLFLSIAIAKRYAELQGVIGRQSVVNVSRGYREGDLPLLAMVGLNSGMLAVLVLTLYINSEHVNTLYAHPVLIWGMCPMLLYWICRVWLLAYRGELHEDPVVFALRDRVSHGLVFICLVLVWLANPISK